MRHVLVIGLGISGQAAAELLLHRGDRVVGVDKNLARIEESSLILRLKKEGMTLLLETAPIEISDFDQVVVSPGVPRMHPLYRAAIEKGIEVIGEAELGFRQTKQRCVAITGTNGKSTVTLLVEHILNASGIQAISLGNIGDPLTTYFLAPNPEETIVAELSSYQLETMKRPVFDTGVILNITPDHLDRYGSMEEYAAAKCRLQECLKPNAPLYIYDTIEKEYGHLLQKGRYTTYGRDRHSRFWTDGIIGYCREEVEYFLPLSYKGLGIHESENALAAWLLCKEFGVTAAQFSQALESFKKPSHRIEFVRELDDVSYFDDSKGTNIDAVIQAVGAMKGSVVLIAGGVDKGASYAAWKESFRQKVKKIFVLGEAAEKMHRELSDAFSIVKVPTLEAAVKEAAAAAGKGDVVLLSPGCSSFDMFRDYAHRGEEFKRLVHHLEGRRK